MTSAVPKLLALTFSVMLGGGYVWFRSGGSIPYIAPAKQTAAKPDRSVLPGSKSIIHRPDFNKVNEITYALPALESVIVEPTPDPVTKYSQYRDPSVLMLSSKSGKIYFEGGPQPQPEPKSEPKPQPETVINNPKPEIPDAQTTVQRERTFLPGSKSFDPRSESVTVYKPQPAIENPKPDAQTTVRSARTILPGSKSVIIHQPTAREKAEELDRFETVIVEEVETTGPDGKKVRTLLPGPKSAFQPLEPQPSAPKQHRPMLSGSKSERVDLNRPNPEAIQPTAPADSIRQSRQSAQPQPQAPAQPQQSEQTRKRTLLPGSKTGGVSTDRED